MYAPVSYVPNFVDDPERMFCSLERAIAWEQREAPRREAFFSDRGVPYTYGRGAGVRTYAPIPAWPDGVRALQAATQHRCGVRFEGCFANFYAGPLDHLGWHADDSPSIDGDRPIAVISLGSARELWFRPWGGNAGSVERLLLEPGSLAVMAPGMQQTHQHRIPKHGAACGPRLSLTFRGLK